MDDNNTNRFIFDTRYIVPIAIAGGVVILIVAFVYCCRHFVYNKRFLNHQPRALGSGVGTGGHSDTGTGRIVERRTLGGIDVAAILPWSTRARDYNQRNRSTARGQHYPPSTHNRANYNSTQVNYYRSIAIMYRFAVSYPVATHAQSGVK